MRDKLDFKVYLHWGYSADEWWRPKRGSDSWWIRRNLRFWITPPRTDIFGEMWIPNAGAHWLLHGWCWQKLSVWYILLCKQLINQFSKVENCLTVLIYTVDPMWYPRFSSSSIIKWTLATKIISTFSWYTIGKYRTLTCHKKFHCTLHFSWVKKHSFAG